MMFWLLCRWGLIAHNWRHVWRNVWQCTNCMECSVGRDPDMPRGHGL